MALSNYLIPALVLIISISYIIMIFLNMVKIKGLLSQIDKKTWTILLLIFVIALVARISIPTHAHISLFEEYDEIETARKILETHSVSRLFAPTGWPFILSIAFALFGLSNWTAIYTCMAFGALTVFPLFLLAFVITHRKDLALIPPLLLSVYAPHITWSATARNNVPSLFFILVCLFFFFVYYKNRDNRSLWLVVLSLAFTVQLRAENLVLPLVFLAGCFFYIKSFFSRARKIKFIFPLLVLVLISLPSLSRVVSTEVGQEWFKINNYQFGSEKSNLSIDNLIFNSTHFGAYVFNSSLQPILFSILFLLGFVYMLRKQRKDAAFLLVWLSLFWLIYFCSWFQAFGFRSRFFLSFFPITAIFASYGVLLFSQLLTYKCRKASKVVLIVISIALASLFIPYSVDDTKPHTQYNNTLIDISEWLADADQDITRDPRLYAKDEFILRTNIPSLVKEDVPQDCVIIALGGVVFRATTDFIVYDFKNLLNVSSRERIFEQHDCILLFRWDEICESGWIDFPCSDIKESIKEEYSFEDYRQYSRGNMTFRLYKLVK